MCCTYRLCYSSPPDRDAVSTFRRKLPSAKEVDEKGYARIILHSRDCSHLARPNDYDIFVDTEHDAEVSGYFNRPHGYMDPFYCARELGFLLENHVVRPVSPLPPPQHSNMEIFTYFVCPNKPAPATAIRVLQDRFPHSARVDDTGLANVWVHDWDCKCKSSRLFVDLYIGYRYGVHGKVICYNHLPRPFGGEQGMRMMLQTCLHDPPQGALPLLPQTVFLPVTPSTNKHYAFNFVVCAHMGPLLAQCMGGEMQRVFPHAVLGDGAGSTVRVHNACCCAMKLKPMDLRVDVCWLGTFCDQSGTKHPFTDAYKMRQLVYESFLSTPPPAHTCSPPGDMATSSSSSSARLDFATECGIAAYGTAIALCEHGSKPALEAALRMLQSQLYTIDCVQLLVEMNKHNHTTARLGQNMKEPLCIFRGSVVAMTKFPSGRTLEGNPPEIGRLFAL